MINLFIAVIAWPENAIKSCELPLKIESGSSCPATSPKTHRGFSEATYISVSGSAPAFVKFTVTGIISPAKTSKGIGVKLTCKAGAGGRIDSSNFLSNCTVLSAAEGTSGLIGVFSKSSFPHRLDGSLVACGTFANNG